MRNVILTPSKKLILPDEIPLSEALKSGLAMPPRRIGRRIIPATPSGMGVFAKYAVTVMDKWGKQVAFRHPVSGKMVKKLEGPSHSFTRNFGQFIRGFLQQLDSALNLNETLTDDAGASFLCRLKSLSTMTGTIGIVSAVSKIKFGNSSAALSTTQINLQGTLLGVTTEATCTVTLTTEDSTQTIFTVAGTITNTSGGSFTVQEMGLFAELGGSTGTTSNTTMMLRDLTGSVVVANTQSITGTWTFTIAV